MNVRKSLFSVKIRATHINSFQYTYYKHDKMFLCSMFNPGFNSPGKYGVKMVDTRYVGHQCRVQLCPDSRKRYALQSLSLFNCRRRGNELTSFAENGRSSSGSFWIDLHIILVTYKSTKKFGLKFEKTVSGQLVSVSIIRSPDVLSEMLRFCEAAPIADAAS